MLLNYCHDYIMFFDWLVAENFTKESMIDEVGFNAQRVLMEYMKIAFADITDYMEFGQKEETFLD